MFWRLLLALCALLIAGCVSTEIETGAKHPASPEAPASDRARAEAALDPSFDPFNAYAPQAPAPAVGDHRGHGAPATATWTCTMHPEIQRVEPGNCPICGMKLVPLER